MKLREFSTFGCAFEYAREVFKERGVWVGNKGTSKTVIINGYKYRIVKTGNYTGNMSAYKVKG